jgi:hypothetical protein
MKALYRRWITLIALGASCIVAVPAPQDNEISWVLFYGNPDRPTSGGNTAIEAVAKKAQQALGAKFMIWFRIDGKSYVSEDLATMDRINRLVNHRFNHASTVMGAERVRKENAEFLEANPSSVSDADAAELRQLNEDFAKLASAPLTATQDTKDLERRAFALVDKVSKLRTQIVFRGASINALRRSEESFLEIGSERAILTDAIASGKAQPTP